MHKIHPEKFQLIVISCFASLSGFIGIFNAHITILISLKGYSHFVIGLLSGLLNFSGIIGPLVVGVFIQKTQRYKSAFVGIAMVCMLMVLGLFIFKSIFVSTILLFIYGFLTSSIGPTTEVTYINFLYNPFKEYGLVRSIGSLGYVLVALIIAIFNLVNIQSLLSISIFGYISYGVLMLSALIFIPKSNTDQEDQLRKQEQDSFIEVILRMNKVFYLLLILIFFNFLGIRVIETYIGLMAKEIYQMESITIFFVISAGFEIIAIYFGQRIVEKLGYIFTWILALGATSTRLLALGLINSQWILYITQALHIASFGLMISTVIHFVNHYVKKENRSIAMSLYQVSMSVATILGVIIGGGILEASNYSNMFLGISIAPLLGLLSLWAFSSRMKLSSISQRVHIN